MREIEIPGTKLTIHEYDDLCDSITGQVLTGAWLWDSALVLSEFIVTHCRLEFDLQGKSVLELGAGTGLPGLTTAVLGARRVVLTDVDLLLPLLNKNVEANGLRYRVEVRELPWGSDESSSRLGEFDLILMSDVFFDLSGVAALAKTLKSFCGTGTVIWSASEIRPSTSDCLSELINEGFEVIELNESTRTVLHLRLVCRFPDHPTESSCVGEI